MGSTFITDTLFLSKVGRPQAGSSSSSRATDKQPFERAARISRDELLDLLFTIFNPEQPYWSLKDLRKRTLQPEAYLKEILGDIADFHRHGPNTNTFSLKAGFGSNASAGASSSAASGAASSSTLPAKMEEDDDNDNDDDDDDDDDEDMEEIS